MQNLKEKFKRALPELKKGLGLSNDLAVPRILKVVVSTGIGSIKEEKKKTEVVPDRLAKITGQKPVATLAKQAIAGFKTREGQTLGYMVTLRSRRMWDFLDRLFNVALPRQRDFRGLDPKAVDQMGNLTIGIKEHTAFPETSDEDLRDVFGLAVTIVTGAKNRTSARLLFDALGFPFKKK